MDICGQDGGGGSAVVVNLDRVKSVKNVLLKNKKNREIINQIQSGIELGYHCRTQWVPLSPMTKLLGTYVGGTPVLGTPVGPSPTIL